MRGAVVMSETPANQDLVIRLDNQRTDETISPKPEVDGWINRSIGIQARNSVARHSIGETELSAQQDLIVWLQGDCENSIARAWGRREGIIRSAIRIEPGYAAAGDAV